MAVPGDDEGRGSVIGSIMRSLYHRICVEQLQFGSNTRGRRCVATFHAFARLVRRQREIPAAMDGVGYIVFPEHRVAKPGDGGEHQKQTQQNQDHAP